MWEEIDDPDAVTHQLQCVSEPPTLFTNGSRLSLCFVGVWPNLQCSRCFGVISNTVFCISSILIIYFIIVVQTTKLYYSRKDLDLMIDVLCTAEIPVAVALVKMFAMRYDSKVVRHLLEQLYDDWKSPRTESQSATMRYSAQVGRKIAAACVGIAYGTSNIFLFLRLIIMRLKQARTGRRGFLFESHFPFDVYSSPCFEIVWLIQGFCTFSATTAYSGIDSFFAVLVLHLCGQFTILIDDFNGLAHKKSEHTKEDITKIVKRHNELNKYAEAIEATFNQMFLVQILACILQLCLQGYQIISILVNKSLELPYLQLIFMVMYICYISLDLFIYCYVAETLREKSMEVADAAYNCKWYNFKKQEKSDLTFIMKRAQYPLDITAGKFCSLSLKLFASIGKTSLGYLSMLLAVKERVQ